MANEVKESCVERENTVNENVVDSSVAEEKVHNEGIDEQARLDFIEDYNARYSSEGSRIYTKEPTKEDVENVKHAYEEAVKEYNERLFTIADTENAVRVAEFLKKWNEEDAQWEGNLWMGCVMLDALLKAFLKEYRDTPKPLEVNGGALAYLFLTLKNVKGVGLKSAIHMQKVAEEYMPILDTVGDAITSQKEEAKRIELLQERWRMFEMGYFIEYDELDKDEYADCEACDDCAIPGTYCDKECDAEPCCYPADALPTDCPNEKSEDLDDTLSEVADGVYCGDPAE